MNWFLWMLPDDIVSAVLFTVLVVCAVLFAIFVHEGP